MLKILDEQPEPRSSDLIDKLLHAQQQLTAVEKFSQRYESAITPNLAPSYRDLIPLEIPNDGEQYSFEVDLDACSGCKSCVAACHSLNGLDEGEIWRNVGLLVGGTEAQPVIQHVTASCHHCLEPACMLGCPVGAYEKDALTGIVEHLDDQCIGCKYCMFMCPYDVPSYNADKGIVRKCNMCVDRLRIGEAPACVQACPHEAIKIRTVSREAIESNIETAQLVPGAPDVSLTKPTTQYNSKKVLPRNLLPDDYFIAQPLHGHLPLVAMLVLTQMALGIFATTWFVEGWVNQDFPSLAPFGTISVLYWVGFITLIVGLNAAIFHLGRPLLAYRALRGIRTSWLSREILAFNGFAAFATATVAWGTFDYLPTATGLSRHWMAAMSVVAGMGAIGCSAILYIKTKRPLWTITRTHGLFFLTVLVLGSSVVLTVILACSAISDMSQPSQVRSPVATESSFFSIVPVAITKFMIFAAMLKLVLEVSIAIHLWDAKFTPLKQAASLLVGHLRMTTLMRLGLIITGAFLLPGVFLLEQQANAGSMGLFRILLLASVCLFAGELLERFLFFSVSVARRMPGSPS